EQHGRAEHEHEAERAPAVAETAEVRLAVAAIRPERDRNLFDAEPAEATLDDHLGRHLHAGHVEVQFLDGILAEAAHAAIDVADLGVEKAVGQPGESGVAEVLVEWRHGAGLDLAAEPIAETEVGAIAKLVDEPAEVGEVVRVVRVAHDDVLA